MKTALIIGASRGIGREFARQLLADGWKVYATARDAGALAELAAEGAQPVKLDVTRAESLAELPWRLDGEQLDLCAYVAGVLPTWDGAAEAPTHAHFDATMHANVLGAMQALPLLAHFVAPGHGKFVFITSLLGSIAAADSSLAWIYRASKAALNMAVHSARTDYPDIVLSTISPGWVQTDMGGSGAPTSVHDSVAGMRRVIDRLTLADSGAFHSYDDRKMAW